MFLLFGDSLTQRGFEWETGGWAGLLANHYIRRVDIINRGYGGYNTEWCLHVLPQLLANLGTNCTVALVVIFLGANDAVLEEHNKHQYVPIGRYKRNLETLVRMVWEWRPLKKVPVILITPPAVYPPAWESHCLAKGRQLDRSVQQTAAYANACKEVANSLQIPVIDFHAAMDQYANSSLRIISTQDTCGARQSLPAETAKDLVTEIVSPPEVDLKRINELLTDGLHLNQRGNRILFDLLLETIDRHCPELSVSSLTMRFPYHAAVDPGNLETCIKP